MLNDIKTSSNKILVCITAAVMLLFIALSGIIFSNEVYAEENSEKEYGIDSSAYYRIIADNHDIGTARLSMSSSLKDSGEGMMIVQVQIVPKVNDGLNDYKVDSFCLDIAYGSHYGTLTNISKPVDNSETPLVETNTSISTIVSPNGVSFQVSSSYTEITEPKTVSSQIGDKEGLPGEYELNKQIYVGVNSPTVDVVINYQVAIFFKVEPTDFTLFTAELYDLKVDGVFLAPDYGVNNNENIFLAGASNQNKEFAVDDVSYVTLDKNNMPEKDGSPNDTLEEISFSAKSYVR